MTWDLSKLGKCEAHGHYAGSVCPLCIETMITVGAAAPPVPAPVAVAAVEEYDRTNWHKGPEKELHSMFENELMRRGVSYLHSRTDLKSTVAVGTPDFCCLHTAADGICRACMVELKNKSGRTSRDQDTVIAELRAKNIPVLITGDFRQAVDFVIENLALEPKPL